MRTPTRPHPIVCSLFLCLLVLAMGACGGSPSPKPGKTPTAPPATIAPPDQQVLRYPIGAPDFSALDPAVSDVATDSTAVSLIFSGLLRLNSDYTVAPDLASAYQVSSDGLSYTFTLHPHLTFSDGTPLTAADVAYSINRAVSPATASPTASFLSAIKDYASLRAGTIPTLIGDSLLVADQETLSIVLSAPAPYFLQALAGLNARVVNQALIAKYGASWTDHLEEGAGAGVFKVSSYSHSQGMVLIPNPDYAGPKARLQQLDFVPSSDPAAEYNAYLGGQLDYAQIPPTDRASALSRQDYQHAAVLNIEFLAMNFLDKPFDNDHIRQAFALAINKDLLASNVLHGASVPTNHLLPQGMPGYNNVLTGPDGLSSTAGDTAKAIQLLRQGLLEEGYASVAELPSLTLTYPTNLGRDLQDVLVAIVQEWQQALGVNVRLQGEDVTTFVSRDLPATQGHTGPLQMWFQSYSSLADPFFWLNSFFGTGGSLNDGNYGQNLGAGSQEQQAVQQELTLAAATTDAAQRTQQYNDAEQKIVNDVGWIPLFQGGLDVLINPRVQNLAANGPTQTWSDVYLSA